MLKSKIKISNDLICVLSYKIEPSAMKKKQPYKRGFLSWEGQFTSIFTTSLLLTQSSKCKFEVTGPNQILEFILYIKGSGCGRVV